MESALPKLSLSAQYDDLLRYSNVLTAGCENEFKTFVQSAKANALKSKEIKEDNKSLTETISELEAAIQKHETQMRLLRNMVDSEIGKRKQTEMENMSMKQQIACIRDILLEKGTPINNQAKFSIDQLLNSFPHCQPVASQRHLGGIEESYNSILSPSDVDVSCDDYTERSSYSRKRHSRHSTGLAGKKKRSEESMKTVLIEDLLKKDVCESKTEIKSIDTPDVGRPIAKTEPSSIKIPVYDSGSETTDSSARTPLHTQKPHRFVPKKAIKKQKCHPCGKHIDAFLKEFLRCSDCKITCHKECKTLCKAPCAAVSCTPTRGSVSDSSTASVPPLLVSCLNHIESKGLKEKHLYFKIGKLQEVEDLKNKLMCGQNVDLDRADIHSVCRTVIDFLQSHACSLIPVASYEVFMKAAEIGDESVSLNLLLDAVCDLSQNRRVTLAYLVLHLQKIAESPLCRTSLDRLAQVFGPIVVNHSEPVEANLVMDSKKQCQVMHCLLKIPSDSWQNLFSSDAPEVDANTYTTPKHLSTPVSRLGPILSSQKDDKTSGTTPKRTSSGRSERKKRYLSPLIKMF